MTCTDCGASITAFARRKTTLCKPCSARANARDPKLCAQRRAKMRQNLSDPAYAAAHAKRVGDGIRRKIATDPAFAEKRRQQGLRFAALRMGGCHLPAGHPSRIAAGMKRVETVLGWCAPAYRDDYRTLLYRHGVPAAEARQAMLQQIFVDLRDFRSGKMLDRETFTKARDAARYYAAKPHLLTMDMLDAERGADAGSFPDAGAGELLPQAGV